MVVRVAYGLVHGGTSAFLLVRSLVIDVVYLIWSENRIPYGVGFTVRGRIYGREWVIGCAVTVPGGVSVA